MKIVVTGATGLLGWHASARLYAENCAARYHKNDEPYELVTIGHAGFQDNDLLDSAIDDASGVLHFAGVNRAESDDIVEAANPEIAQRLIDSCSRTKTSPWVVYANTLHASKDTPYGRSKRIAGEIISKGVSGYTDLILPHIFGEGARPYYNNVTATFIDQVKAGIKVVPNKGGKVKLLHAGAAANIAIDAFKNKISGQISPQYEPMLVEDLLLKVQSFHDLYSANIYPDLSNDFNLALFNTYRAPSFPKSWPRYLDMKTDPRGALFEAVKGGGGGQTFVSVTNPGVIRGNHFHLNKVERFLVLQGKAIIRIRKILDDTVYSFNVTGEEPAFIDMPTLHTHSIENIGDTPLLTLFWADSIFDPSEPDTYTADVLRENT